MIKIQHSWITFTPQERLDTLLSSGIKTPQKLIDKQWWELPLSVKTKLKKQTGEI